VTPFQQAVATVLLRLKPGEVVTYGEVAGEAGFLGAGRAVGTFLRDHGGYPWWRVVRNDGQLASSDPSEQARRLAAEGLLVRNGRVVLHEVRVRARSPNSAHA
jgi:methylated-DNA-protein-cysteine methyltransferase related protein